MDIRCARIFADQGWHTMGGAVDTSQKRVEATLEMVFIFSATQSLYYVCFNKTIRIGWTV